jgi:hypothetical protein
MKDLQQIVVQLTNSPDVRSILQYGNDFLPESQTLVKYDDLNQDERDIWDNFILMLKTKV